MASSPSIVAVSGKSINQSKSPSSSSAHQPQNPALTSGEAFGARRGGGNASLGSSNWSRQSPTPRNNQNRKQHKPSRRFKPDEDAIAERVRLPALSCHTPTLTMSKAAMRSTNSRKGQTSITHLMNFSLPPRPQSYSHYPSNNRYGRRTSVAAVRHHGIDKSRYVYGNYRFIVDPRHDYHALSVDADVLLDWSHIFQVLASPHSQGAACPICLDTPVAARMAKCGHIFCLPCLIRFMHSDDETNRHDRKNRSKACPLCWDHFTLSEVKPVRWYEGQDIEPPKEGQDVVLRLMKRSAGSTLALPRDGAERLADEHDVPWYYAAEVLDYARIMKGTGDYMIKELEKEISALEQQEKEDEVMFGDDNVEWAKRAIRALNDAKSRFIDEKDLQIDVREETPSPKIERPPIEFKSEQDAPTMYTIQHAAKSGHIPQDKATEELHMESSEPLGPSQDPVPSKARSIPTIPARQVQYTSHPTLEYYFYQALLHYYLSPLDIRILKEAFGSFAAFPATILPRVERVSTGHVIDDEMRRRAKWLAHLPRGCEVNFLECDWTDTVSPEVLEKFKDELQRRKKRNEDKDAREERDRVRAEKEEEKQYAYLRRRRAEDSPAAQFHANDFQPLGAEGDVNADVDITSSTPPWGNRSGGSAFASLANLSTSPSTSRTVWGTAAVAPSSPPLVATEDPAKDDGWLQGWEDALMDHQLTAQVDAMRLNSDGGNPTTSSKKKKGKKITLMSTTVRRGA
jgi:E3 ubiquitin-protein ligase RNF10